MSARSDLRSCSTKSMTIKTLRSTQSDRDIDSQATRSNKLCEGIPNDYLPHTDNVFVATDHERHDLPQARDREPVLFFVQLQLFQRDDIACLLVSSTKHNTIRALFDMI
jgi:hypothetical protein